MKIVQIGENTSWIPLWAKTTINGLNELMLKTLSHIIVRSGYLNPQVENAEIWAQNFDNCNSRIDTRPNKENIFPWVYVDRDSE